MRSSCSLERLAKIDKELANLTEQFTALKAHWDSEKKAIGGIRALKEKQEKAKNDQAAAERQGDFNKAAEVKYGVLPGLQKEIDEQNAKLLEMQKSHKFLKEEVDAEDIAQVVAKWTHIPVSKLLEGEVQKLVHMEDRLAKRVIGQRSAIEAVSNAVRRARSGLQDPNRPIGSFIFLGPTGVGKTEMARSLAEVLFGSKDLLVRLDMSEMSESHGVSRLIGSPAGYVGYGDGGQLTEPVRRRPSCVVVLDEIEKAHREVQLLLLQVLEEGRLTDGKDRHIDFSNTVIVLTTNLGAEAFHRTGRALGFGTPSTGAAAQTNDMDAASNAARQAMPPELWNRIDERLPFRPLTEPDVARIATLLLDESRKRLATEKGIEYVAGADVVELLMKSGGFDPKLGARPMRQVVQRLVEAPLAERILAGEFTAGDRVQVSTLDGELQFQREEA